MNQVKANSLNYHIDSEKDICIKPEIVQSDKSKSNSNTCKPNTEEDSFESVKLLSNQTLKSNNSIANKDDKGSSGLIKNADEIISNKEIDNNTVTNDDIKVEPQEQQNYNLFILGNEFTDSEESSLSK